MLSAALAGCRSGSRPPATAGEPSPGVEETRPSLDAAVEQPTPRIVLRDTPTHRQLFWVIDVLGRRQGVIELAEINEHWDASSVHGPVAIQQLLDGFRQWGAGATSATVDKVEVDDPTYLLAHLTVGGKSWRVILSLGTSSMKIDYMRWTPEQTAIPPAPLQRSGTACPRSARPHRDHRERDDLGDRCILPSTAPNRSGVATTPRPGSER